MPDGSREGAAAISELCARGEALHRAGRLEDAAVLFTEFSPTKVTTASDQLRLWLAKASSTPTRPSMPIRVCQSRMPIATTTRRRRRLKRRTRWICSRSRLSTRTPTPNSPLSVG
jgi:hypothetical protein